MAFFYNYDRKNRKFTKNFRVRFGKLGDGGEEAESFEKARVAASEFDMEADSIVPGAPMRKHTRAIASQLKTDMARTKSQNMDSGTRKKMKSFYYRQDRAARGLTTG